MAEIKLNGGDIYFDGKMIRTSDIAFTGIDWGGCMETMKGPYLNEDGDWWVAVEDASYREAREAILACLDYDVPSQGTLVYRGKEMSTLCDAHPAHDVGPECDSECSRRVETWHFVERRFW